MIFLCNLQKKENILIKVINISKSYGKLNVLSDISFNLNRGEIVGLLGVNGAGKSTLLKILSGVIEQDQGVVEIFGETFGNNASLNIKNQIGYLSEDNPLYEDMYVDEYLDYIVGIYNLDKTKVQFIFERVGLAGEYKKKISVLSKGNRQRVGIIQALIHDPRFLMLDEATGGLDPNQRESINNLIQDLSKDKIILLSTHILSDVRNICSRLILIDKGRIVADKRINEIDSIENIFFELTNENNSR